MVVFLEEGHERKIVTHQFCPPFDVKPDPNVLRASIKVFCLLYNVSFLLLCLALPYFSPAARKYCEHTHEKILGQKPSFAEPCANNVSLFHLESDTKIYNHGLLFHLLV